MSTKKEDEMILCFEKDIIDDSLLESGNPNVRHLVESIISIPGLSKFVRRGDAETDTTMLQPIPYCLIMCTSTKRVLSYKRSKKGGEARLHDMYSVGFGGHVNADDAFNYLQHHVNHHLLAPIEGYRELINSSLCRELFEELEIREDIGTRTEPLPMYIYDSSTEVSSVHFGLPYICLIDDESSVKQKEDAVVELEWLDVTKDSIEKLNFESWSKIVLKFMLSSVPSELPSEKLVSIADKYQLPLSVVVDITNDILSTTQEEN